MDLSIIVPTYGRTNELENLLESICLLNLDYKYEVLIIDQNEKNILKSILEKYELYLPIRHHRVYFRGLSKARNYGITYSEGKLICFPDDDAEFKKDTVENAMKYIQETGADCVYGRCIDKISGKVSISSSGNEAVRLNLNNFEKNCLEATMFIKRSKALQYLFDEQMGVGCVFGSQEGYDIAYRMLYDNCKLYYSPEIEFYHPEKVFLRVKDVEIKRSFYYNCGFGYLCRKHRFKKKYMCRIIKISIALPIIFIFYHKTFKYYFAQWMGMKLGYQYL